MPKRDAVYARISEDDLGTERGVMRQTEDGRALSRVRDGNVVFETADNDISALKGASRPGYERLMAAVDAGEIDRVIVFHTSRLWRNRRERADGIERLRAAGVSVLAVKGPELDLSSAAGRMMAGILGEFDTGESEIKGERIARAALQRAQEGRANGPVLYGWRRVYEQNDQGKVVGFHDVVDETQAEIVREIVRRLLGGESLRGVTADLNSRGVPAPGFGQRRASRANGQKDDGQLWQKTSVKKIALRPANIGLRIFHRGKPDEALLPAAWPPLVAHDDHYALVGLLSAPGRNVNRLERPGARVHLLSWGIGECGLCGSNLRVGPRGNVRYGVKKLLYLCDVNEHIGRNRDRVDELVGEVVVERLSRSDVADLLIGDDRAVRLALERAEGLRARLDVAAAAFAADEISASQLKRISGELRPALAQAEHEARLHQASPYASLVAGIVGDRAKTAWEEFDVTQRRAVVSVLIEKVRILPVVRRGPGFDPTTVEILWRQDAVV